MPAFNSKPKTYAAIKVSRDTITAILRHVTNVPAGQERLIYAMLKYPFKDDVPHYFIGGNYLKLNQPDYSKQILTQSELDLLFTYSKQKPKQGRTNPDTTWFPVTLIEDISKNMLTELGVNESH